MNKKLQFLCIIFLLLNAVTYAKDVYVATNGSDANNGTINSPYKTFSKAVSVMSAGDVCIIRAGVYEQELLVNRSGNSSNFLTFKAAAGEDVTIRATTKVSGWQVHDGNIYKANVTMSLARNYRTVYHNDVYMDLARWPNNTDNNRWTLNSVPVTGGDGSHFTANNIPNINWIGGLVYYLGAHSGASWTRPITSSTTSRINHTGVNINKWPFNPHNPTVWRNYPNNKRGQLYLFDKLEALDYAREWYYDPSAKLLYFKPANGNKPKDGEVSFANNRYTAQINGNYVKVEGLKFFGGSVRIKGKNNIFQNNEVIHGTEGHDDLNNTSANIGNAAIEVMGANTLVKDCVVNHSAANGITVVRWSGAHNSTIEGNYISNTDYLGIHTTPIRAQADNIKVLKNTIVNAGRDGMYVSGNNSEVAYNDVSNSELINSDSGIFYTVGNSSLKNIEIHHNWFHDATAPSYSHETGSPGKAAGIYLDNDSQGYTVHHNVIWNVSWSGYQVNWNNENLDFFHNTIWNAERAMDSWVNGRSQKNNKVYNNYSNKASWFEGNGSNEFDIKNNVISSLSPFENANNQKFMPKANSSVVDKGMIISGFTKLYKGSSPDIGAYERGGTPWTAGVNAIEDNGSPLSVSEFDGVVTRLKMYPNPASNFLNIRFSDNQNLNQTSVAIYSLMGKLVKEVSIDEIKTSTQISVQDLSKGVYLIKVKSPYKNHTGKFVKQ